MNAAAISKPRLAEAKSGLKWFPQAPIIKASQRRNEVSPISKKSQGKTPKGLIRISTSDGKWHGKWNLDYRFSLHDLQLQDLTEDIHKADNEVSITICIQKHTGFGLSVDGKIITSFTRKCSNCSSPYCREIDTNFNVWVLPSSKQKNSDHQLPEIGGDDPSLSLLTLSLSPSDLSSAEEMKDLTNMVLQVIYVKPGDEVNFDSLIQDTIRLATAVKETCSESCEKSEPLLQYVGAKYAASVDRRWSRLLELRNAEP